MEPYQNAYPSQGRVRNPLFDHYNKLGGALLFFYVIYIIGICLSVIVMLAYTPNMLSVLPWLTNSGFGSVATILVVTSLAALVQLVLLIGVVITISTRNRHFLTLLVIATIIELLAVILGFVLRAGSSGMGSSSSVGQDLFGIVRDVLILVYFCKSVRVRTYMGSDEYLTRGFLTSWVTPPLPVEPYLVAPVAPVSAPYTPQPAQTYASAATPATPVAPVAPAVVVVPDSGVAAGWYQDPIDPEYTCWWDGQQWLPNTRKPLP